MYTLNLLQFYCELYLNKAEKLKFLKNLVLSIKDNIETITAFAWHKVSAVSTQHSVIVVSKQL